jgi:hypothetical protein
MKKLIILGILIPAIVHAFSFHFHLFPKQLVTSFTATGGTISYLTSTGTPSGTKVSGGYTVHTFTSNGTFLTTGSKNIEYLIVGGGGSGGGYVYATTSNTSGGGGAGGLLKGTLNSLSTGSFPVVVGLGAQNAADNAHGSNGENSSFNGIIANGGGGGAAGESGIDGYSGGSGGGGDAMDAWDMHGADSLGGAGTIGQGYAGGSGGGGGGGAGGAGGVPSGGIGVSSSINGTSIVYAKGGDSSDGISSYVAYPGYGGRASNIGYPSNTFAQRGIVILRYLN